LVGAYNEENDPTTAIVDLLADLRHLCDTMQVEFHRIDNLET